MAGVSEGHKAVAVAAAGSSITFVSCNALAWFQGAH